MPSYILLYQAPISSNTPTTTASGADNTNQESEEYIVLQETHCSLDCLLIVAKLVMKLEVIGIFSHMAALNFIL